MNEIMKTLTIITTIFMPISFLAGFFGMNFFQPVAESLYFLVDVPVFVLALLVMIGGPVAMLFWMRKRGWL
jgi:magnesium transporter